MRVCLICVEIFAWGKLGGYGRATRAIGRELVKRGVEVFAVVPRRGDQKAVERLDGMTVLSFPLHKPWQAIPLLTGCNADVYHTQEPSIASYFAWRCLPGRTHVITVRDPKFLRDWLLETRYPSVSWLRTFLSRFYDINFLVKRAVRQADGVFCTTQDGRQMAQRLYKLERKPGFLPSPIPFPESAPVKSPTPLVCFVGRFDPRKRPEAFFELARQFPEVEFVAAGKSHSARRDREIEATWGNQPNLRFTGWLDQFSGDTLFQLLERSWILVNCAPREGLPTSFLEAMAYGCAILSQVNPDGIAEKFGYHAAGGNFADGLRVLLHNDAWRNRGESGRQYAQSHYEWHHAIDTHLRVYQTLSRSTGTDEASTHPVSRVLS